MKLHIAAIACMALTCSCDEKKPSASTGEAKQPASHTASRMVVTSDNAPKNDGEALKIAKISMTPPPEVVFRSYEAGLDGNMKLVLRLPKGRIDEFWIGSPWSKDRTKAASGDGSKHPSPRISSFGDPEWLKWKTSSVGNAAEASLPDGEVAQVYLAEDLEGGVIHVFIFWHQT